MFVFGALLAGTLASHVGAPTMVATGGVLAALGAVVFAGRLPALRADARSLILAQPAAGGDPPEEMVVATPAEQRRMR